MKMKYRLRQDRNGAMLPLIAVTLLFIFVAAFFAVDMSRIHVIRSEMRTATDAAARAAVESLGRTESEADAIQAALDVARLNFVDGQPLELDPAKITFGFSEQNADDSFSFVDRDSAGPLPGGTIVSSVRVVGERTETSPDGPINFIFGGFFGVEQFEPVQTATATRIDRDIALALDKSGSMAMEGRFDALLNGVSVFVEELRLSDPIERVSLIAYDTLPRQLIELTEDLLLIRDRIGQETPSGRTGIGLAMRVGLDSLQNDPNARRLALKSMVVMTDGIQNAGVNPLTVAEECRQANVIVHTITFSSGANQALMAEVARRTGGTHLHATDDAQLVEAFRTIARQLQVLLIE